MSRALEGINVVAIEQAVAAPFATCRLADAGASVTKVERAEGDFARWYDDVANGQSSYFVWLNRGKKSVTLDLSSDKGKAALTELLETADVLVQNLKPGSLEKLGFSPEQLCKENPRLIICSISGFGKDGPMASRKAYDLLIQAESGLCELTGTAESGPSRVGISVVDIATGATAYSAILEALIRRGVTGMGAQISVSMFDVMCDWLTVPLLNFEGGKNPSRIGLAHPSIAPYGVFNPKTGRDILIAVQSDREWRALCAGLIGDESFGTDPRFATNVARVENRQATDQLVADAFARLDYDVVLEKLNNAGIALASVNDMKSLSEHAQLKRISVDTPGGPVSYPAPGFQFSDECRNYGPVPKLAELCDV